jgi:membrane protein implicated in regulation of membrane protease activity
VGYAVYMYGRWLGFTLGGVALVLLIVGLAFAWASPLFAIPIVLAVAAAALLLMVGRRAGSETPEDPHATNLRNRPDRPDAGKAEPSH